MVEWSPPNERGEQSCPAHPDAGWFNARRGGCPGCALLPAGDDGDPRAEEYAEYAEAKRAADGARLPDAHAYEHSQLAIRDKSAAQAEWNRDLAGFCAERAKAILSGDIHVSVPVEIDGKRFYRDATASEVEREAREWMKEARGFSTNARSFIGDELKSNGRGLAAATVRDSDAKLDERQRAKHGRRAN